MPKKIPVVVKKHLRESRRFSVKGSGIMAGGGTVTFKVPSPKVAVKILKSLQKQMAFWQVSQRFAIKSGRRKAQVVSGFSIAYKKNQISEIMVKRALSDAAVNAANSLGYNFKYEGGKPDIVTPKSKTFLVLVWFNGRSRQTMLRISGDK